MRHIEKFKDESIIHAVKRNRACSLKLNSFDRLNFVLTESVMLKFGISLTLYT